MALKLKDDATFKKLPMSSQGSVGAVVTGKVLERGPDDAEALMCVVVHSAGFTGFWPQST